MISPLKGNTAWRALSDKPGAMPASMLAADRPAETDVRPILCRTGFQSPDQVRAAMQKSGEAALARWRPAMLEIAPGEVAFALARCAPKGRYGRRGLPAHVIEKMHADYRRLGSLARVGKLYGRTRQAMYDIFRSHGLELNARNFHARILFAGRIWTPGKGGYYRPTTGNRAELLHHVIYEARTGRKVPSGWRVGFKDGDNSNFGQGNLVCMPIQDMTLLHYRRRYQSRSRWTPDQRREFWKRHYRDQMRLKARAYKARGLRCDGKPMRQQRRAAA